MLLTEQETAQRLRMTRAGLRAWRFRKQGPPYCKIGRLVRYNERDLEEFVAHRRRLGEENSGQVESNGR